ncbi:MAG: hypothetical protein CFE23_16510 [Flavobacterium sp. BFFFF1]|uniref:hypothetical protein n=1 Tax=Flavobacterium sp. BFFFF1 TaxID=2015557 RepID=UPI000BCE55C7|nr:hypothetical protein [Flavobacterium sp. BFFFF1]OYU78909.1 MAG: hypothetical protein CFE23_16510 [Flavobacterium sp. BFFFF1]
MNENSSENFTDNFEKEIFKQSFDLSIDYAEISLDAICREDALKEIPIVKSLLAFYNISSSIVARHNVKKIIVFLQQFQSRTIDRQQLNKFKERFKEDMKFRNSTIENILVLLEKFTEIEQAKILANLFSAYIKEDLTWDEFKKMSFIIKNLNPAAYEILEKKVNKEHMPMTKTIEGEGFLLACGIGSTFEDQYRFSSTGEKLFKFGMKS